MKHSSYPLIGIIGGRGKMGNWFKIFFEKQGLPVIVSGRKTKLSNIALAKKADIVIVSVPLRKTIEVIKEVRSYVRPEALLADFASLKEKPLQEMKKAKSAVLGMHPLFGPLVPSLEGQNIVFCRAKDNQYVDFLQNLFEKNGAKIIDISPKEHDYQMAFLQALTHFSHIAFAHFLYKKKFQPWPFFFTPVFKLQSLLLGRILAQNPRLYAEIEMLNPYFPQIVEDYTRHLSGWQESVVSQRKDLFQKRFQEASSYLSDFIKTAEKETGKILKSLEKKPIKIGEVKKIKLKKAKIGFLGPKGTFSWEAAQKISSAQNRLLPLPSIKDIFEAVNNGEVDLGVVPFQNAIAGVVTETIYSFIDYPLYALGSFRIPIHHCLFSQEKSIKDIKEVKSHPQALSQCRLWLEEKLPQAQKMPTASTIAPLLEKDKKGKGFIAPAPAASLFGLNVLAKNIEDVKENFTRFLVIGRDFDESVLKGLGLLSQRTLLLLSVYDRPGILRDILDVFAKRKINLSFLHSIPSHFHAWDYLFFLEIEESYFSLKKSDWLSKLDKFCPFVKIIGAS